MLLAFLLTGTKGATPSEPDRARASAEAMRLVAVEVELPAGFVLEEFQPDLRWGGRTVAVDISPSDPNVALAATASGGLFKTTDGGTTWSHIDDPRLVAMADVAFHPDLPQIAFATVRDDSHKENLAGIWRSTDGGEHWARPAFGWLDPGPCFSEPNPAWDISIRAGTEEVYVGLDCGVAVSNDQGANFDYQDVNSQLPAYGVVALDGFVDACGPGGHFRKNLSNPAAGWVSSGAPGMCTDPGSHPLDASPVDPNTVFAVLQKPPLADGSSPQDVFQGTFDPATATWKWVDLLAPGADNRPPFVKAHRALDEFFPVEVYFGNGVDIYRQRCPSDSAGTSCTAAAGAWTAIAIDHSDQSDIAYPTPEPSCAALVSSDGGVHRPGAQGGCGESWTITGGGKDGFNALQIYEVTGQIRPDHTDLYFGTQDNSIWSSANGGATWPNSIRAEGFFLQPPRTGPAHDPVERLVPIITGVKCWPCDNFIAQPHFRRDFPFNDPVAGAAGAPTHNPFLLAPGIFLQWHSRSATSHDLYIFSGGWRRAGTWTGTRPDPVIRWGGDPRDPTGYSAIGPVGSKSLIRMRNIRRGTFVADQANGRGALTDAGRLLTLAAYATDYVWSGVFGVDPADPRHVIAADIETEEMKVSTLGGIRWALDPALTDLVTAGGDLLFTSRSDPGTGQPSSISFDPLDPNRILIGTAAAGIITTADGGLNWAGIEGSNRIPNITSFYFGHRARDGIILSSYGRGLWRMRLGRADLSIQKTVRFAAAEPVPVVEGELLIFDIEVTNHGPDPSGDIWVTDTLPPQLDLWFMDTARCSGPDADRRIRCKVPSLEPGESASFNIQVRVRAGFIPLTRDFITSRNLVVAAAPLSQDPLRQNDRDELSLTIRRPFGRE